METKKPLWKRNGKVSDAEREHLKRVGALGGASRSEKKLKAIRLNLRKAMAARFPKNPKWRLRTSKAAK